MGRKIKLVVGRKAELERNLGHSSAVNQYTFTLLSPHHVPDTEQEDRNQGITKRLSREAGHCISS